MRVPLLWLLMQLNLGSSPLVTGLVENERHQRGAESLGSKHGQVDVGRDGHQPRF